MEFWTIENPLNVWQRAGKLKGFKITKEWYESGRCFTQLPDRSEHTWETEYLDMVFNYEWYKSGMPYYKIYPSIIKHLTKLNMEGVTADKLQPPSGIANLAINLPKNNCISPVRNIFISHHPQVDSVVSVGVDVGDRSNDGFPEYLIARLHKRSNEDVASVINCALDNGSWSESDCNSYENALRLVAALCLLGDSPEIIQPEILNADERKLKGQHSIEALVAKARRRGKYGFTIGKDIETSPHLRRSHFALVWYGPGKKESKIIMRKGCVVHRSKVEKIPTGYGAEENA